MGTFGYETIGDHTDPLWVSPYSYLTGTIFVCPEDCVADSLTVALSAQIVLSEYSVKCAIYDKDRNFVAATEEKTGLSFGSLPRWETFTFASPPSLNGGEDYYLVAWAVCTKYPDYQLYVSITSTPDDMITSSYSEAYNDFPATLGALIAYYKCSIYCTYTPAPAKKPVGDGLTFAI